MINLYLYLYLKYMNILKLWFSYFWVLCLKFLIVDYFDRQKLIWKLFNFALLVMYVTFDSMYLH